MLRVQIHNSADTWRVTLEGRFAGEDAEHARMLIMRCPAGVKLVADLTEVIFIDNVGEEVLSFLGRLGALFIAPTSYTLDICERLHLALVSTSLAGEPVRQYPQTSAPIPPLYVRNKKRK